MVNHSVLRATPLLLAGLLVNGLLGCGDDDEAATTTTTAESTTTQSATTTTTDSTTTQSVTTTTTESTTTQTATTEAPDAIAITFTCGNGETGSTDVPTGDIEQIDDVVNTIDLCEFRGGLTEISFTAPCPSGDRAVTVSASDGALPDIATLDLCENP